MEMPSPLIQHMDSRTIDCIVPLMHNVLTWARIGHEENHKEMIRITLSAINFLDQAPPETFGYLLPDVLDLMLVTKKTTELFGKRMHIVFPFNHLLPYHE